MEQAATQSLTPYRPESIDPLQAALYNALCVREIPQHFTLHDSQCSIRFDPWQAPLQPAGQEAAQPPLQLSVQAGSSTALLVMGSPLLLRLHPAGALIEQWAELPPPLVAALAELALAPLLTAASQLLATPVQLRPDEAHNTAASYQYHLPFYCTVGQDSMPLSLLLNDAKAVQELLQRLGSLSLRRDLHGSIPLSLAFEIGRTHLAVAQLRELAVGDVLLPQACVFPPTQLRICVSGHCIASCTVNNNTACVSTSNVQPVLQKDSLMTQEAPQTMASAPAAPTETEGATAQHPPQATTDLQTDMAPQEATVAVTVEELEVTVCFELDRKNMTVAELAALQPGYCFALDPAPQGQVTLRANGSPLGLGRLVDMNGTLGVQVTSLATGHKA